MKLFILLMLVSCASNQSIKVSEPIGVEVDFPSTNKAGGDYVLIKTN